MQHIFERYEEKYLVCAEQGAEFKKLILRHMEPDQYGEYLVQNLYYDTENWDVVRASTQKPLYKEKMRLRCYNMPHTNSKLFLELKKKFAGIVYKRRIAIPFTALSSRSVHDVVKEENSQIARELDFYLNQHDVFQRMYIAYRRIAFTSTAQQSSTECEGLRVTFDSDIRFRLDHLDYANPDNGYGILPQGTMVMEIKTQGGVPLWMARSLAENRIFPMAFSKYGVCYSSYNVKQPCYVYPSSTEGIACKGNRSFLSVVKMQEELSA
jgi:hypothetical protein